MQSFRMLYYHCRSSPLRLDNVLSLAAAVACAADGQTFSQSEVLVRSRHLRSTVVTVARIRRLPRALPVARDRERGATCKQLLPRASAAQLRALQPAHGCDGVAGRDDAGHCPLPAGEGPPHPAQQAIHAQ